MTAALEARDPALLDPFLGSDGQASDGSASLSLVAWGLGYPGQPHILARFMAIRNPGEMPTARRVAMGWVIVVLRRGDRRGADRRAADRPAARRAGQREGVHRDVWQRTCTQCWPAYAFQASWLRS